MTKTRRIVAKYPKVRYHKDRTVVVTDDRMKVEHPRIPPQYLPNAIIETVSQRGKQIGRMFYDSTGMQYKQLATDHMEILRCIHTKNVASMHMILSGQMEKSLGERYANWQKKGSVVISYECGLFEKLDRQLNARY